MMIFYRMIFIKKIHKFFDQGKKKYVYHTPAKYFGNKKMTTLGLDEISTFDKGKVVKIFFGFTMLTQKNVQFNLSRLLVFHIRR